jgi:hypothetical protein
MTHPEMDPDATPMFLLTHSIALLYSSITPHLMGGEIPQVAEVSCCSESLHELIGALPKKLFF